MTADCSHGRVLRLLRLPSAATGSGSRRMLPPSVVSLVTCVPIGALQYRMLSSSHMRQQLGMSSFAISHPDAVVPVGDEHVVDAGLGVRGGVDQVEIVRAHEVERLPRALPELRARRPDGLRAGDMR